MQGKDVLLNALRGQATDRPAWVPFVGVHGGALIGKDAAEYLRSADHIVEGLTRAAERYKPDGLPVVFDLQMEAEVLGCQLQWAEQSPPSVVSHPLADGPDPSPLPEFDPDAGRFPLVMEAVDRLKDRVGDEIALYGLVTGPFTLATHLRGNEIFLDMFDDEEAIGELMAFCAEVGKRAADAYIDHGCDVIAVVDPMTSQISPDHFARFVTPYVNAVFDHVRHRGALSSIFVCGDATRNLEKLCQTHADNVSIDENIPLEMVRDLARAGGKSFGGNLKLTLALLMGDADDAKLDAIRCIDVGEHAGFVLAPGCDLPYATPPENLEAVAELVHDNYQRQVARTTITAKAATDMPNVELPDYASGPEVYIDVVTLDSASCAPCQYMVGAANEAAKRAGAEVIVREHKITSREGVAAMMKLGAEHIPTICIDGRVAFSSIIPDGNVLARAIDDRAEAKRVGDARSGDAPS